MSRINVMQPWLGDEEAAALAEVVASGWVAQGPRVAAFEEAFAASQQIPYAVAASSCTTALHLALLVADIGRGDDVVVPSLSFIATANAAMYVGAQPVFADVDPTTGNLTAETVERALTDRITAVVRSTRAVFRSTSTRSASCATRAASWSSRMPRALPARPTAVARSRRGPRSQPGRSTRARS